MKSNLRVVAWLLLLLLPESGMAQFNFLTNDGTITITGYTGPGGAVVIPSSTNGWPVASIGTNAFYDCYSLSSVMIPNSVTSIADNAFYWCIGMTTVVIGNNVTTIGTNAFFNCTGLTNVFIPNSVTSIGNKAFAGCISLTNIMVDVQNTNYSSVDGVLFNNDQTSLLEFPNGKEGTSPSMPYLRGPSYAIPNSVTSVGDYAFFYSNMTNVIIPYGVTNIGNYAFEGCQYLPSVSIPDSVTSIGAYAFQQTQLIYVTIGKGVVSIGTDTFQVGIAGSTLNSVFFKGAAPSADSTAFQYEPYATAYFLPGATGWSNTFDGLPAVLWNPTIQTSNANFGTLTNGFGFTITGTTNIPIVVEACTNLASPVWVPLQSCTISNGSIYFSDPAWTNYSGRFYRISSP